MQFIGEFRIIKRGMGLEHGAFGFHENHRFIRNFIPHFFGMRCIVTAYTKNLHKQAVFLLNTSDTYS
jgi:hypothetical protein